MPKEIDGVTYWTKDEIYMDQSEVDKAIQDRLARVEKKPDDYDDIKSKNAELVEKTRELEQQLSVKDKERDDAVAEAVAETRGELLPEVARAQIRAEAVKRNFRNPEDALTFFGEIPDDLDEDGIQARLSEIASERDYLVQSADSPSHTDVGIGAAGAGKAPAEPGIGRVAAALEPK